MSLKTKYQAYFSTLVLITAICLGGLTGYYFGNSVVYLKPIGDLFLRLIFTVIVPVVFFSIASAVVNTGSLAKLGRILFRMLLVFLFTGVVAGLFAMLTVILFLPAPADQLHLVMPDKVPEMQLMNQIAGIFTVNEFWNLFSHEHMVALILFSLLLGIATLGAGSKGQSFANFLRAGDAVFMQVFTLIMYLAPLGFFAYFAVLVQELGPQLLKSYLQITKLYYLSTTIYFLLIFSIYAYLAGKRQAVTLFWSNIFLPLATSIATCSSAASIPANLLAARNMRVAPEIYETVVPLGTVIHKDGSVIGGMFKIAFLFAACHVPFAGFSVLLTALGMALLVGTVMGAIPSGGMLGELLILQVYGFPPSFLLVIAAISILIDPLATMVNVTGNTVSSMMIARLVDGKKWLTPKV